MTWKNLYFLTEINAFPRHRLISAMPYKNVTKLMPYRIFFRKKMSEEHVAENVLQEKFIKPDLESKRNYLTNAVETRQRSNKRAG